MLVIAVVETKECSQAVWEWEYDKTH